MTPLLFLGVVAAGRDLPGDGPAFAAVRAPDLQAICAEVDPAAAETLEGISDWAQLQNAVLCAIAVKTDVLPIRLGSLFSSPDALRGHLVARGPELKSAMAEIAGRCQYDLCAEQADPQPDRPTEPPRTGAAFLTDRRRRRDARQTRAMETQRFLGSLVVTGGAHSAASRSNPRPARGRLLCHSLLVARDDVPALLSAMDSAAKPAAALGLRVCMTGPMPPFAFSSRTETCHA
ncbi:hypothetical protein OCH239_11840 [Roseivivax halodurans JCM 10272]|uniref:Gas vesicle protein n=1 Tax=Roseivivax halodurans JCM 10272 TaxID=1449350 RepID=X7EJA7_9RHOB|nr:GvpL/GvpF family gas vesicle protein [Roseivivax halodurans]ETX15945.1 hypothetical protein OCH239_11840 [Roseivivax halodurans JCM 10272]